MKIVVASRAEQKLVLSILKALEEFGLEELEKHDHDNAEESNDEPFLDSAGYRFLDNGFSLARVVVDESEKPMKAGSEVVTGTCVSCGTDTEGIIESNDITYNEYLNLTDDIKSAVWQCADCFIEEG